MFWVLLLSHLLADYPLQPTRMVMAKNRMRVLLLHAAIQFLTMFILVGAVRTQIWVVLLIVAVIHFFFDWGKISIINPRMENEFAGYLLDQALHIIVLTLATLWITELMPAGYIPPDYSWAIIITGFLLVTYVWYTTEKIMVLPNPDYLKEVIDSYIPRMLSRALMLLLLLIGIRWAPGTPLLAALIPYRSGVFWKRELITDVAVATTTAIILIIAL